MSKLMLVFFLFLTVAAKSQNQGSNSGAPTFGMTGKANLSTNFVEKGLTQTEGDPNLQGEFWFNFGPQFRLGLWGSNVRYDSTPTTHFWLRLNADVKVDFSAQTNLVIKYSENKYYRENNRNGNTIGLHLDLWGYKFIYDMESNWEGTGEKATYMGLGKDTPIWNTYIWNLQGGYTMPEAEGVSSFFDVRTGLGKKMKDIFVIGSVTYSNASGDFKDRGKMAFILSAQVKY